MRRLRLILLFTVYTAIVFGVAYWSGFNSRLAGG